MHVLKVPTEVVDMETGVVTERRTSDFQILAPADPEACKTCAERHEPDQPHNKDRLHYQYTFYSEHGRWPTWKDAVAHCSPEIQAAWEEALRERGAWPKDEEPQP